MLVIELTDRDESAAYCGKLLTRWGADVVRVEPPGDHGRWAPLDLHLNGGKRRIAMDPRSEADLGQWRRLLAGADLLISDLEDLRERRWWLDAAGDLPPVRALISPFGRSGPYQAYEATTSTLLALGGYTHLSGDPGRAPLTLPGQYPYYQAGTFAYIAALAAHLRDPGRDAPVEIEVSVLETVASLHQFTDIMWTHQGRIRSRHGNRWEDLSPTTLLPCADGWVAVNILPNFWEPFAYMIGRPDLIEDPRYATNEARLQRRDEVEAIVREAFADRPKAEIFREGQETWRVPVGQLNSASEVLVDPHLGARDFWRPLEGAERELLTPGSPFRFVGAEPPPERAPARPDAHDADAVFVERGAASSSSASRPVAGKPSPRILEGVRVVDLTRIWSGPLATRILGDLGAEVIKIEAPTGRGPAVVPRGTYGYYADDDPGDRPWNRQGLFNKLNRNKQSVAVDLKRPEGREAFLRLIAESDVVIENFSARAMPGLDLGYEQLREVNDQIIYVAMPAFGLFGPYRDYIGLGPSIEPLTGMTAVMGYGDDEPRTSAQALTDAISGTAAAAAVVTAIWRRRLVGQGALIDLSQEEAGVAYFGEFFLEQQLTGREPARLGNRHREFSPHGVYRCRGEDEWIAIAVRDDDEWRALAELAGRGWESEGRFATAAGRREHADALDAEIERWTSERGKTELMQALQDSGVPAGAVQSAPEWLADPHLEARGYFFEVEELEVGQRRYDGSPLLINGDRGYREWTRAPGLGEHGPAVLSSLGYSADEIAGLQEAGVLVDRPPAS